MSAAVTEMSKDPARPKDVAVSPLLSGVRETAVVPVFTLVVWIGCVLVGVGGFLMPYVRPRPAVKTPPPVTAQLLNVELTSDPLPPPIPTPPPPKLLQPPPLVQPTVVPSAPPMISVAAPSPQIAFALPIAAPAPVVPAREASYRTVEAPPVAQAALPATAQPLTFGQGEGKQPAPEYPREALREGQEGNVTVRMTVNTDGRVLAAEASSPSPWPLLNQAAVRVVKSRWRFTPGPVRAYEVAIRFQLNK